MVPPVAAKSPPAESPAPVREETVSRPGAAGRPNLPAEVNYRSPEMSPEEPPAGMSRPLSPAVAEKEKEIQSVPPAPAETTAVAAAASRSPENGPERESPAKWRTTCYLVVQNNQIMSQKNLIPRCCHIYSPKG